MYKVKSKSEKQFEIRDIQEKLETLCSRVDNLESKSFTKQQKQFV